MCGLVEDAEAGRLPELQRRLENGEDVNSLREGETALMVAATSGQLEVLPVTLSPA
jgi:ankyrin repeat protein